VWDYAAQILDDLGFPADRSDPELAGLLQSLGSHPLAMQAILRQMEDRTAGQVRGLLE
jgi:hypothetical protein